MSSKRKYLSISLAAFACAVAAWWVVSASHPFVRLPDELFGLTQPSTEQYAQIREYQNLNDTIGLAMFGAFAMLAGVPVFVKQMSWLTVIVWSIIAACLGSGAGWLMGVNGFYCDFWLPITWDALVRLTVRLTATLLPFALLAAVLTVIGTKSFQHAPMLLVAAGIGSVAAAMTYSCVTGIALPRENADAVLPPGMYGRLLLFGIAPLMVWAVIEYQLQGSRKNVEPELSAELNVV